jgi:hypothetical protein
MRQRRGVIPAQGAGVVRAQARSAQKPRVKPARSAHRSAEGRRGGEAATTRFASARINNTHKTPLPISRLPITNFASMSDLAIYRSSRKHNCSRHARLVTYLAQWPEMTTLQAVPINLWTNPATGKEEVSRLPQNEIACLTNAPIYYTMSYISCLVNLNTF